MILGPTRYRVAETGRLPEDTGCEDTGCGVASKCLGAGDEPMTARLEDVPVTLTAARIWVDRVHRHPDGGQV